MTQEEVLDLMKSSNSEQEWNANCDKVKSSFRGNYPQWWFALIIMSGVYNQVSESWTK